MQLTSVAYQNGAIQPEITADKPLTEQLPDSPQLPAAIQKTSGGRALIRGIEAAFPSEILWETREKLTAYAQQLDAEIQRVSSAIHAINAVIGLNDAPIRVQTSRRNQAYGAINRTILEYLERIGEPRHISDVFEYVCSQRAAINHDVSRPTINSALAKMARTHYPVRRVAEGTYEYDHQ